ncbi:MAG: asparagine synthase-related protein, partial [Microvirga sp.]
NAARFPTGRLKATPFWTVDVNLSTERFDHQRAEQYADQYRALLRDAVRLRLRSDVPVGTAFSGGLDSSSIVHFINDVQRNQPTAQRLKVFSTVYPSAGASDCDESPFIDKMIENYGLEAHGVEPQAAQVPEQMRKMVWAMENPQESTLMSYMFTYGLVRKNGVTVTLDGQGADELQGGYQYYITNYLANVSAGDLWREYKLFATMPGVRSFARMGVLFNVIRQLGLKGVSRRVLKKLGKLSDPFNTVNERLHRDYFNHMLTLLHYGDHSSMANSVEARYPFLDYRLAEFWHGMPGSYKLHAGWTKYVARLAMDGLLPDEITWRRDKMGWEIPQDYWFRGELKEWFCATIENSNFLQSMGLGRDVRRQLMRPHTDHKSIKILLRQLNLALWHDTFFPRQAVNTGDLAFVIVTPVRNEGDHIEATLRSVIGQSLRPALWVIVDDHSTDDTPKVLRDYASRHDWIRVVGGPDLMRDDYSSRVVQLFNYGRGQVDVAYDIVAKLDGDVSFGPEFFANILGEFCRNPRLGIASGHLTINGIRETVDAAAGNTRGATKFYRLACLTDIGGLYPYTSWDTIDNAAARAKGWETRMLPYEFEHLKPEGTKAGSALYNHYRTGLSNGRIPYVGTYFVAKALSKLLAAPLFLAPFVQLVGYIETRFIRKERPFPDFVTRQIRKEQKAYLIRRLTGGRFSRSLSSRDVA